MVTTYGSAMFAEHVPARDAEIVRRARAEGAIVLGKTQTHELAWGVTSVNRAMGSVHNPWSPRHVAGGSSGGSAAALAADLVPLSLGSDTGGSIRIPSSFCGTVGLKPTYGRVSLAGALPLAPTLDHAGPMARTPADAALLLAVIAGVDWDDPATTLAPNPGAAVVGASVEGLRVGVCPDLQPVRLVAAVEDAYAATLERLGDLGAILIDVELPEAAPALESYIVIQRAEALWTHGRAGLYPSRASEYGADVRQHLDLATRVTLTDYLQAGAERERLRAGFQRLFTQVDLLVTPVAAITAPEPDTASVLHFGDELTVRELILSYTVPQDLAGLPACALRAGFDEAGLPVGVQLTGPLWAEERVLAAARALYDASAGLQAVRPTLALEVDAV